MFYHILYPLRDIFFGFNVFRYITFRAVCASVTAFLISLFLGPFLIRTLKRLNVKERVIKEETCPGLHKLHKNKEETPTMGGILIVASIILSTLLWADLSNPFILFVTATTLGLGLVGFIDDYLKLKREGSFGLTASTKLIGQLAIGAGVGLFIFFSPKIDTKLDLPFFKDVIINLGLFYIIFAALVIAAASNAVNLTDGLDGLAIGCLVMVALTYGVLSYIAGHIEFSEYLFVPYIRGAGELSIYCSAIVGAGLGFLWYNAYPASIFMGDTGALALGGGIGCVALFVKKELLLLLVGGIFVIEALSVILQVGFYKLKRKRLFLVAPFHHHFEIKGWPEPKVTVRFWIVAAILALASLATLKLR